MRKKNSLFSWATVVLALSLAALALGSGCAKIPPSAAQLNEEVGTAIISKHQAYVNLLDLYFEERAKQVDVFLFKDYLPVVTKNMQENAAKRGGSPSCLPPEAIAALTKQLITKRSKLLADLQKTKQQIISRAEEQQKLVLLANGQLTSLLQSAADVESARSRLAQSIGKQLGYEVDLTAMQEKFDSYLVKAGDAAKKGTSIADTGKSLYDTLKPIWDKEGGNK
jgi:hypothetical protein